MGGKIIYAVLSIRVFLLGWICRTWNLDKAKMTDYRKVQAGRKGGHMTAHRMTKEQKVERARKAALKRWGPKSKPADTDEIIRKAIEEK